MEKFRWCFIGTGTLAKKVAKIILSSGRHEIVSVYTRREEPGLAFTKKYGGKLYKSAEEAMKDPNVDGVYIVTPHNSHYEYGKLAMSLKKPTLLEKPFTVSLPQTKALIDLAKKNDTYIVEAMWTWFGEPAYKVKEWVEAGEFGKMKSAYLTFCVPSKLFAPRVIDAKRAGGALLDIGIYPITFTYRLFGYPEKIEAKGLVKNGVDYFEDIYFTYPDGFKPHMRASINDFKGFEQLSLVGERAKVFAWDFHETRKFKLKRKKGPSKKFEGEMGYLNEFDLVVEEIRSGRKESKYVPFKSTIDVMEIMDEVRNQIGLRYDFEDA